jgi:hypothetical protein
MGDDFGNSKKDDHEGVKSVRFEGNVEDEEDTMPSKQTSNYFYQHHP